MTINDPLGDMLTRIRNAHMRGRTTVVTPGSRLRRMVLDVLVEEGYIAGYQEAAASDSRDIEISLKYYQGKPVISEIRRVSKPGRRVYSGADDIPLVRNGLGICILSTPGGVMSDHAARAARTGGEVLCQVS